MAYDRAGVDNISDSAKLPEQYVLNNTSCTTVCSANPERTMLIVSNMAGGGVWIKFQPASMDISKKGIFLAGKGIWKMPGERVYIGEVSAISEDVESTITCTKY